MARFSAEHLAKLTKKNVTASTRNLMLTKIIAEYGGALSSIAANIIDEHRNCRMDVALRWYSTRRAGFGPVGHWLIFHAFFLWF